MENEMNMAPDKPQGMSTAPDRPHGFYDHRYQILYDQNKLIEFLKNRLQEAEGAAGGRKVLEAEEVNGIITVMEHLSSLVLDYAALAKTKIDKIERGGKSEGEEEES